MNRMGRVLALGIVVVLHACSRAGDEGSPAAVPPPPPPIPLALDAGNYQGAMRSALELGDAAFSYTKLGADTADRLLNTRVIVAPVFGCRVSGAGSITLSDRNGNGMFNSCATTIYCRARWALSGTPGSFASVRRCRSPEPLALSRAPGGLA